MQKKSHGKFLTKTLLKNYLLFSIILQCNTDLESAMSTLQVSVNSELLMPYLIQKETQVSVCWMMHEQRCCKLQSTSAGRWSMCTHSTSTDAKKTTNCLSSSFELVLVSRARTAWVYLTWHIVNNIKRDSDKKKRKKKKNQPWQTGGGPSIWSRSPSRHVRISLPTNVKPGRHEYRIMSPVRPFTHAHTQRQTHTHTGHGYVWEEHE